MRAAATLAFPEQDSLAPEEDWTAGLPLVLRGIQQKDWKDIVDGVVLSFEQTERYQKERGPLQSDDWHDRTVGINQAEEAGINKWLPKELMSLAEQKQRKQ